MPPEPPPEADTALQVQPSLPSDGAELTILSGASRGRSIRLPPDGLRVGKAPDNEVVLTDPTVSRHHVLVSRSPRGFVLQDQGSTNGIKVAGALVQQAVVEPGTIFHIGDVAAVLRLETRDVELPPSMSD